MSLENGSHYKASELPQPIKNGKNVVFYNADSFHASCWHSAGHFPGVVKDTFAREAGEGEEGEEEMTKGYFYRYFCRSG